MWTALVRQLMVFLFTRRGRRIVAFVGVLLLFFITLGLNVVGDAYVRRVRQSY